MGQPEEPREDEQPEVVEPETPETVDAPADADAKPDVVDAEVVEAAEVVELPTPLEVAEKKRAEAEARLRTVSKAYTDLQNEMAAFRDRMETRSNMAAERQAFSTVSAFLEPVENLKRSMASPGDDVASLVNGLGMVHRQFLDALTKLGLEEVPGEGAKFDPNLHEALAVTPVADPEQDGKVLMVHQGGYSVKGKVLRAAQVVIGKLEEPTAEA